MRLPPHSSNTIISHHNKLEYEGGRWVKCPPWGLYKHSPKFDLGFCYPSTLYCPTCSPDCDRSLYSNHTCCTENHISALVWQQRMWRNKATYGMCLHNTHTTSIHVPIMISFCAAVTWLHYTRQICHISPSVTLSYFFLNKSIEKIELKAGCMR